MIKISFFCSFQFKYFFILSVLTSQASTLDDCLELVMVYASFFENGLIFFTHDDGSLKKRKLQSNVLNGSRFYSLRSLSFVNTSCSQLLDKSATEDVFMRNDGTFIVNNKSYLLDSFIPT